MKCLIVGRAAAHGVPVKLFLADPLCRSRVVIGGEHSYLYLGRSGGPMASCISDVSVSCWYRSTALRNSRTGQRNRAKVSYEGVMPDKVPCGGKIWGSLRPNSML